MRDEEERTGRFKARTNKVEKRGAQRRNWQVNGRRLRKRLVSGGKEW